MSIQEHKKLAAHNLTRTRALHLLTNIWSLSQQEIAALSITEYVLHTLTGQQFRESVQDGIFIHYGISYSIVYRSCTPTSAYKSPVLRISTRCSPLGNFAIVQPAQELAGKVYGITSPSAGNK